MPSLRTVLSRVRIQAGEKYFSLFSETSRRSLVPNLPSINGYRGSFQAVQWPGRDVELSPPSSAEVKNEWSYASMPFTCFHGVDRDSFIFLTFFFKAGKFGIDKEVPYLRKFKCWFWKYKIRSHVRAVFLKLKNLPSGWKDYRNTRPTSTKTTHYTFCTVRASC